MGNKTSIAAQLESARVIIEGALAGDATLTARLAQVGYNNAALGAAQALLNSFGDSRVNAYAQRGDQRGATDALDALRQKVDAQYSTLAQIAKTIFADNADALTTLGLLLPKAPTSSQPAEAVIDGGSNTVVATLPSFSAPIGIGVNATTNRIYVANQNFGVPVLDGADNTLITTVPIIGQPYGIGVNPATNRVYVAYCCSKIAVIDGATNTVLVEALTVGSSPEGIGVNPTTNRIYVANQLSSTISVIDGDSNTVIVTLPVGFYPYGVGVNPTTNRVYVANYNSNTVSVIGEPPPGYASAPAAGSTLMVGKVKVGSPVTATLTIHETGNATLNVTSHSLSGANAAEFNVSPATLSILDGGAAQPLFIRCTPSGLGLRTATLLVNHNAPGSPASYTLNCTGQVLVYLPSVLRTTP